MRATLPGTVIDNNNQSRSRWQLAHTVVLLLFAAVFISYIDRTNISVAAIAMQEDLGWTETDKGVVLSSCCRRSSSATCC